MIEMFLIFHHRIILEIYYFFLLLFEFFVHVRQCQLKIKHCNFLINQAKASSKDMKNLINFIKENVYKKKGVNLELEIILTSLT